MESKRNTTLRIVSVVPLHVFHLPSPQYGLPGSFATHPSLSVSLFGSFLLFYYSYFTYHLTSMGSQGLLPPTPPSLCHSSDRSCCSTTCISLTISPVWVPRVFCHPPLLFCVNSVGRRWWEKRPTCIFFRQRLSDNVYIELNSKWHKTY